MRASATSGAQAFHIQPRVCENTTAATASIISIGRDGPVHSRMALMFNAKCRAAASQAFPSSRNMREHRQHQPPQPWRACGHNRHHLDVEHNGGGHHRHQPRKPVTLHTENVSIISIRCPSVSYPTQHGRASSASAVNAASSQGFHISIFRINRPGRSHFNSQQRMRA